MEGRKIQRVGYSTLSVSLPADWVKQSGLKQGDILVFIPERDGSMKILPSTLAEGKINNKEVIVDTNLCDESGLLERIIVGNYVLGRDTVILQSSKRIRSEHVQEARNMVRRLIGLGIIEETPNRIVLQCSIDPSKFPLDTLMRRLYILASTMHKESMQALIEGDLELAKDTAFREEEANTIYWLILRLLISAQRIRAVAEKVGLKDTLEIIGDRIIAKYLEGIADYSKIIAVNVIGIEKYKTEIGKKAIDILIQMSELAYSMCQHAMDGLFTGDIKVLNSTMEMKNIVENSEQKLIRELPTQLRSTSINTYNVIGQIRSIAWSLVRIAEHSAMIAEIAMNRAIEKGNEICKYANEDLK